MALDQLLILFCIGSLAGFLNVMAGGGSAITLPVLIFMGLDGALANGTNRVAILIQNIFAISSFKQQKVGKFKESLMLSLWTLPGAVAGAFLAVRLSDEWFQKILAIIMIGIVISMMISPTGKQNKLQEAENKNRIWIYPALFGIGFYGGFIQVGVGFLFMAALYHILKLNLVFVNMHKVFIIFIYTIPALGIFMWTGNVNWALGLSLAAGNAFGGWWSAKFAVKSGEKLIRIILSISIVIMALKLFKIF